MILIVSMERPERYDHSGGEWQALRRFERLTGRPCVTLNYPDASLEFLKRYPIKAIFIEGFGYGWEKVPVPKLKAIDRLLHETDLPVLGACGGHQLIGHCFNQDLSRVKALQAAPMRKLKRGEPDVEPDYHPGFLKEHGIYEVTVTRKDPLFDGLKQRIMVCQSHFGEVKRVPKDFVLLAQSSECKIQAMRHKTRPLFGVQFHPERWDDAYPDGKQLLINFFKIAGLA